MTQNNLRYWLAAIHMSHVRPNTFLRWVEQASNIDTLFQTPDDELMMKGIPLACIEELRRINWKYIDDDLAWAQKSNHHLITIEHECYPNLLKEISNPPLVLYVWGEVNILRRKQIAMVGSRNATPTGLKCAEQLAYRLTEIGVTITSGLASGIDGASHRGALQAKGMTIGVCGTGLNHRYPKSNTCLYDAIIQHNGAIISEFPLFTPPRAINFPRRNRIIAGLSLGVAVIEAAIKSGSLITARYALEQGKEVFAVPGSILNPLTKGCHHLIRQGAKLVETAEDIIEELEGIIKANTAIPADLARWGSIETRKEFPRFSAGTPAKNTFLPAPSLINLTLEQQQVLSKIEYEITPLDMILLRSGLTKGEVFSILLVLELNGYIQSVQGGYVRAH